MKKTIMPIIVLMTLVACEKPEEPKECKLYDEQTQMYDALSGVYLQTRLKNEFGYHCQRASPWSRSWGGNMDARIACIPTKISNTPLYFIVEVSTKEERVTGASTFYPNN